MMRLRRLVKSLLPSALLATTVVLLLLFFFHDTPTIREDRHNRQINHHHHHSHRHHHHQPHHPSVRSGPNQGQARQQAPESGGEAHESSAGGGGRKVVVVSLARSGSSLTGSVLSHGPGVYYGFEPLRASEAAMWARYNDLSSGGNVTGAVALELAWRGEARDILRAFLTCSFSDLDLRSLDADYLKKEATTRDLAACVEIANNNHTQGAESDTINDHRNNIDTCLVKAEQKCHSSKVKVLKIIRLSVHDLEPLMADDPDLVLLLLVRDPRASLWSRLRVFNETSARRDPTSFVHSLCNRLDDDLSALLDLRQSYEDRVGVLRYETLARDPVRVSQLLYRFAGLPWTGHVQNAITRQTSSRLSRGSNKHARRTARNVQQQQHQQQQHKQQQQQQQQPQEKTEKKKKTDGDYSVVRESSALAAHAWRQSVDWSFVRTVQERCFPAMRRLGYTLFRHQVDVKDLGVETYRDDQVMIDRLVLLQ